MNSLCIKTNNEDILQYLKNEFSSFNMLNVYFSTNEFKLYKNIIIHYTGIDSELFYEKLATILSYLTIDYFENDIVKNILVSNYFYFDNLEIDRILDMCMENISDNEFNNRHMLLFDAFYDYITENHSIVLSGFINFRLSAYREIIEDLVNLSVNEFIIEREYLEFISLLKLYINSQPSTCDTIHLVCFDYDSILLDEDMNILEVDKDALNAKYLSDVSFSNNDYILNTLLNLLPNKVFLHLTSISGNLDFINTLKLIFEDRLEICTDCNICDMYKKLNVQPKR